MPGAFLCGVSTIWELEDEDKDDDVARMLVVLALVVSFVVPPVCTIVAETLMIRAMISCRKCATSSEG